MTEVKSDEESFPSKRKPDLPSLDKDNIQEKTDDSNKKKKFEFFSTDDSNLLILKVEENKEVNGTEHISAQKDVNKGVEEDEDDEDEEDYEAEGEDDDDDGDEEAEYDDSDDNHSNGNAEVVDQKGKGKGIMTDDKGKGKLIEESEDSSECGSESNGESDLSDDPLAEVDLDNILPTRTRSRRHVAQHGMHISDNEGVKEDDNDDNKDN